VNGYYLLRVARLTSGHRNGEAKVDAELTFEQYAGPFLRMFKNRELVPPRFFTYYAAAVRDPARLRGNFLRTKHGFDMIEGRGKVVLDVGCGFGHNGLWAAMLGAAHVHCIDLDRIKIQTCAKLAGEFGVADKVEARIGSAFELPYPDRSIDAILNYECIEHFEDLGLFFREAARVLTPGGRIFSQTGANALSVPRVIPQACFFRDIERTQFIPRRAEKLKGWFPALPHAEIERLALYTRGLTREAIRVRAQEMLEGKKARKPSRFSPIIDPDSGVWAERPINPYGVVRIMREAGLEGWVLRSTMFITGKSWKRKLANVIGKMITATHPVSLLVSPTIQTLGLKQR
jgi:2-polyprenyl-3-methyl-5-hydroxy-6-metoxy-1,4-benzoquinol methylase